MNIGQSVQTILRRPEIVTDLFYIKYLDRYPQVRPFFEGIELQHQSVVLKLALTIIQQFYEHRYPAAEQYLLVLGHRHRLLNVPSELYADWRDTLLDTLEQFHGAEWSTDLKSEWTAAIQMAADVMHRGYDDGAFEAATRDLTTRTVRFP